MTIVIGEQRMSKANVTTHVRRVNGVSVIDIPGEVNAYAEEALAVAYADASQGGVKAVVLNFSGMEYMNSSGIGLLVTLLIRAQRAKQRLLACGLNEHYQQDLRSDPLERGDWHLWQRGGGGGGGGLSRVGVSECQSVGVSECQSVRVSECQSVRVSCVMCQVFRSLET